MSLKVSESKPTVAKKSPPKTAVTAPLKSPCPAADIIACVCS